MSMTLGMDPGSERRRQMKKVIGTITTYHGQEHRYMDGY